MKTIDPDDPRLTAYAIGELPEAEVSEVEALLKGSPEARAEVEEIRATAALLEREFGAAPEIEFSAAQRGEVLAGGAVVKVEPGTFRKANRWLGVAGIAACLVAVGSIGVRELMDQERKVVREADTLASSQMSGATVAAGEGAGALTDDVYRDAGATLEGKRIELDAVGNTELRRERESLARAAKEIPEAIRPQVTELKEKGDIELASGLKREALTVTSADTQIGDFSLSADAIPEGEGLDRASRFSNAVVAGKSKTSEALAGSLRGGAVLERSVSRSPSSPPTPELAPAAEPAPAAAVVDAKRRGAFAQPMSRSKKVPADAFGTGGGGAVTDAEPMFGRPGATGGGVPAEGLSKSLSAVEADASRRGRSLGRELAESFDEAPTRKKSEQRSAAGEDYAAISDTPFVKAFAQPLSTFAVDVDTGSYTNIRRFLGRRGQLPPADAVRVEEMINYFDYSYAEPDGDHPFAVDLAVASCPWTKEHRLVRVALKGKSMEPDKRPPSNLIFLVDVSGSMRGNDKLPLLKESLAALVRHLNEDDRIGIVTYAGKAGVAMGPKHGDQKGSIIDSIDKLKAGGSTNGAGGIELAYKLAKENFVEGGTNRVVLATDGDFNVGTTDTEQLIGVIKAKAAEDKIHLTVLGFGEGNLKEQRMEQIANKGDGNYYYIDDAKEGRRVLVDKLSATLVTIAKDVKIQVDFNPAKVHSYRLIGYANRRMAAEDFRNDKKDAGEIGAGHTVTALYEIVPADSEEAVAAAVANVSRYLRPKAVEDRGLELVGSGDLLTAALRYKAPDASPEDKATEFELPLKDRGEGWAETDADFRFAAAVAGFGMQLRRSPYRGEMMNYDLLLELASEGIGEDPNGLRKEFVTLVERAKAISGQ